MIPAVAHIIHEAYNDPETTELVIKATLGLLDDVERVRLRQHLEPKIRRIVDEHHRFLAREKKSRQRTFDALVLSYRTDAIRYRSEGRFDAARWAEELADWSLQQGPDDMYNSDPPMERGC